MTSTPDGKRQKTTDISYDIPVENAFGPLVVDDEDGESIPETDPYFYYNDRTGEWTQTELTQEIYTDTPADNYHES